VGRKLCSGRFVGVAMVLPLLIAGCGGGDNSPLPSSPGSLIPAPTPTPMPTGIPPRQSSASYEFGFTPDKARSFDAVSQHWSYVANRSPTEQDFVVTISDERDSTFTFTPSRREGEIVFQGERHLYEGTDQTYRASTTSIEWFDPSGTRGSLMYAKLGSSINKQAYYAFVYLDQYSKTCSERKQLLVGTPTLANDFPASGIDRANAFISLETNTTTNSYLLFTGQTELEVDYNRNEISGTFELKDSTSNALQQTLELEATFDPATNQVVGTLNDPTIGAQGKAIGSFYGPYAVDFALAVKVTVGDGRQFSGTIGATRKQ